MRSQTHAVKQVCAKCPNHPSLCPRTHITSPTRTSHMSHHLHADAHAHVHSNVQPKIETVGADLVTTIPQGNYYANLYGGEFKAT